MARRVKPSLVAFALIALLLGSLLMWWRAREGPSRGDDARNGADGATRSGTAGAAPEGAADASSHQPRAASPDGVDGADGPTAPIPEIWSPAATLDAPAFLRRDRAPEVLAVETLLLDVACPLAAERESAQLIARGRLTYERSGIAFQYVRVDALTTAEGRRTELPELERAITEALAPYGAPDGPRLSYASHFTGSITVRVFLSECE